MACLVPGCRRSAHLYEMPLVGRSLALCRIHGPARMIATMRSLVARG